MQRFIFRLACIIGCLMFCLSGVSLSMAQTVITDTMSVTWDANTESDLKGYRIYFTNEEGKLAEGAERPTDLQPCGGDLLYGPGVKPSIHSCAVPATGVMYYSAVTAFDTSGNESKLSNVVEFQSQDLTPPAAPKTYQIQVEVSQQEDGSQRISLVLVPVK